MEESYEFLRQSSTKQTVYFHLGVWLMVRKLMTIFSWVLLWRCLIQLFDIRCFFSEREVPARSWGNRTLLPWTYDQQIWSTLWYFS